MSHLGPERTRDARPAFRWAVIRHRIFVFYPLEVVLVKLVSFLGFRLIVPGLPLIKAFMKNV
jgi:hypothetical protein